MNQLITIKVNGDILEIEQDMTIADLLSHKLEIEEELVAVEINKSVLPKSQYSYIIQADDEIEIVAFFGGG